MTLTAFSGLPLGVKTLLLAFQLPATTSLAAITVPYCSGAMFFAA